MSALSHQGPFAGPLTTFTGLLPMSLGHVPHPQPGSASLRVVGSCNRSHGDEQELYPEGVGGLLVRDLSSQLECTILLDIPYFLILNLLNF